MGLFATKKEQNERIFTFKKERILRIEGSLSQMRNFLYIPTPPPPSLVTMCVHVLERVIGVSFLFNYLPICWSRERITRYIWVVGRRVALWVDRGSSHDKKSLIKWGRVAHEVGGNLLSAPDLSSLSNIIFNSYFYFTYFLILIWW